MQNVINETGPDPSATAAGQYRLFRGVVRGVTRLSPSLTRITFGGAELADMAGGGLDQRIKLLFPRVGQVRPCLPGNRAYRSVRELPTDVRPILRTYTLRAHRPRLAEADVDFVVHEADGPGSAFARQARPGDEIAIGAPDPHSPCPTRVGVEYDLARLDSNTLIIGDETALPAIGCIVESLPRGIRALVCAEVPDPGDALAFATPAEVRASWFVHHGRARQRRHRLLDAIRSVPLEDRCYVWAAGESGMVRAVRRLLVRQRGFPVERSTFMGYWKLGWSLEQRL